MKTTKSIQMDTFYGLNKYLHTHIPKHTLLHAHIRETRDMPKSTKINPHDFPFLIRWSMYLLYVYITNGLVPASPPKIL